jgi:hypothetical protein
LQASVAQPALTRTVGRHLIIQFCANVTYRVADVSSTGWHSSKSGAAAPPARADTRAARASRQSWRRLSQLSRVARQALPEALHRFSSPLNSIARSLSNSNPEPSTTPQMAFRRLGACPVCHLARLCWRENELQKGTLRRVDRKKQTGQALPLGRSLGNGFKAPKEMATST